VVAREVTHEPEKAQLLARICLAVSGREDGISQRERREIVTLCGCIGVDPGIFGLGSEETPIATEADR
jgi:tellurite resistance protein